MECPVNGGDGQYSYSRNSNFQRSAIDAAKDLIRNEIINDSDIFSSLKTIRIADLGCAAGPNTFHAVQNIVESIEIKLRSHGKTSDHSLPEFQVFFNDHASNDFNHLFSSIPPESRYFSAGVPGSFYERLFPRESMHFVHSSYSVQILSRIPEKVLDKNSPAWNKGRIHYTGSETDEVSKAYRDQHAVDMEVFLKARAQEIVNGGFMALILPSWPEGTSYSESLMYKSTQILGSCFIDLANKGQISHEKVDSFNLPMYFASPEVIEAMVKRNGLFAIQSMKVVPQETPHIKTFASTMRSGMGAFIWNHFGVEISDELFGLLSEKFEENSGILRSGNLASLFVLLKRI